MREIKFRAWDTDEEKMKLGDFGLSRGVIVKLLTLPNPNGTWRTEFGEQFNGHLMQYTGLKDRKGKEIYEGDILKKDWNHEQFVVEWGEGEYPHQSDADSIKNKFNCKYGGCEIIGNVWEHPQLLTPSK